MFGSVLQCVAVCLDILGKSTSPNVSKRSRDGPYDWYMEIDIERVRERERESERERERV